MVLDWVCRESVRWLGYSSLQVYPRFRFLLFSKPKVEVIHLSMCMFRSRNNVFCLYTFPRVQKYWLILTHNKRWWQRSTVNTRKESKCLLWSIIVFGVNTFTSGDNWKTSKGIVNVIDETMSNLHIGEF